MVTDLLVVSATTADLQAAYDFAKWMSFSSEGYAREAELAQAANSVPTRMPVSVNAVSIDLYMSFVGDRPGLRQALENLDNSLIELLVRSSPVMSMPAGKVIRVLTLARTRTWLWALSSQMSRVDSSNTPTSPRSWKSLPTISWTSRRTTALTYVARERR